MSNYGEILKSSRKRAGMRINQAAMETGIHASQISMYEHEKAVVGPERLETLAKVYGDSFLWQKYMRAAYPSYAEHHTEMEAEKAGIRRYTATDEFRPVEGCSSNQVAKNMTKVMCAREITDKMIQDGVMVIDEEEEDGTCRITATVYALEGL